MHFLVFWAWNNGCFLHCPIGLWTKAWILFLVSHRNHESVVGETYFDMEEALIALGTAHNYSGSVVYQSKFVAFRILVPHAYLYRKSTSTQYLCLRGYPSAWVAFSDHAEFFSNDPVRNHPFLVWVGNLTSTMTEQTLCSHDATNSLVSQALGSHDWRGDDTRGLWTCGNDTLPETSKTSLKHRSEKTNISKCRFSKLGQGTETGGCGRHSSRIQLHTKGKTVADKLYAKLPDSLSSSILVPQLFSPQNKVVGITGMASAIRSVPCPTPYSIAFFVNSSKSNRVHKWASFSWNITVKLVCEAVLDCTSGNHGEMEFN